MKKLLEFQDLYHCGPDRTLPVRVGSPPLPQGCHNVVFVHLRNVEVSHENDASSMFHLYVTMITQCYVYMTICICGVIYIKHSFSYYILSVSHISTSGLPPSVPDCYVHDEQET